MLAGDEGNPGLPGIPRPITRLSCSGVCRIFFIYKYLFSMSMPSSGPMLAGDEGNPGLPGIPRLITHPPCLLYLQIYNFYEYALLGANTR